MHIFKKPVEKSLITVSYKENVIWRKEENKFHFLIEWSHGRIVSYLTLCLKKIFTTQEKYQKYYSVLIDAMLSISFLNFNILHIITRSKRKFGTFLHQPLHQRRLWKDRLGEA